MIDWCGIERLVTRVDGYFFVIVVQFWRKVWYSEIHQVGSRAGPICDPEDWALHPSWMESWVHFIFALFTYILPYFIELTDVDSAMIFHFWCLWVLLRGLPFWLREIQNVTFRTDNEPFKVLISPVIPYFLYDDPWFLCKVCNDCGIWSFDISNEAWCESNSPYKNC